MAGVAFLAVLASAALRADVIYIGVLGVKALQENHLVTLERSADGKNWMIVGQVVTVRDANDQPVLPNPRRYWMFKPSKGPFTGTDVNGNPDPNSKLVRLDFTWTGQMDREVDSLDNIRDIISNRDLRYQSGAEALQALLADLDPLGEMHLKGAVPAVAYPGIVPREGSYSTFLLRGLLPATELAKERANAEALPSEDPLSYSPLDPVFHEQQPPGGTALLLARAAARCSRYGETEPGLRDSCLAVLHFMCDTLYVEPADVPVGTRTKATQLRDASAQCRRFLLNTVSNVGPQVLCRPPLRPEAVEGWPRAASQDDPQPVSTLDLARTCLEVLDGCRNPHVGDQGSVAETLLLCAANQADCRAVSKRPPLAPYAAGADGVGKQALDVLCHIASPPTDGSADTGAYYRSRIRLAVFGFDDPAIGRAAREAAVRCGLGSEPEVAALLDYVISRGTDSRFVDQAPADAAYILQGLPAHIPSPAIRTHFQEELARRVARMQESVRQGYKDPATLSLLGHLGAMP